MTEIFHGRMRSGCSRGWRILLCFFIGVAGLRAGVGVVGDGAVVINDGGMAREYELALDEISIRHGDKRDTEVLAATNVAELMAVAETLRGREKSAPVPGEVELVVYEKNVRQHDLTRRYLTRKLVVQYADGTDPAALANELGLTLDAIPAYAPGLAVLAAESSEGALAAMRRLRAHAQVASADPLIARWRVKRSIPNDTLFSQQWHLRNTGQGGGVAGIDANVTPAWDNFRGAGVTIGIIDDGVQYSHPDISPNYNENIDYDFNNKDTDPKPEPWYAGGRITDSHGTSCAGIAAARGNNNLGVTGVAYEATLAGYRLTAAAASDQDEADAFAIHNDVVQIKSNSWGPDDDGRTLEAPGSLAAAALKSGVTSGRGGLGTIYVFAAGNGNDLGDNSNYDGYANSMYTIAVSALNDYGFQSWYSEPGANIHVCAPSNGGAHNAEIVTADLTGGDGDNSYSTTTDLTNKDYTKTFGGTSASCPLVAGVCALMLQANPGLGWRDVQEILMRSAKQVHHADSDWITNGAGIRFNHKYGAGLVDANAAVTIAQNWINLGPQTTVQVAQGGLPVAIPDPNATTGAVTGVSRTFTVNDANLRVEHVTLTLSIAHARRGDLEVVLTSPSGTVSRLAEQHGDTGANYAGWTFTTLRNWGESAVGDWILTVTDRVSGTAGSLTAATLNLYGSSVTNARVVPGTVVMVAESNLPANSAADPGETVTYNIGLKNIGIANGGNITATLLNLGGVTGAGAAQNYGALTSGGAETTKPFTFVAGGTSGTSAKAVLRLDDNGVFIGYATVQIPLGAVRTATATSAAGITIIDNNVASPYPSSVTVSGIAGKVHNVSATLNGFNHPAPRQVKVLLNGPAALSVVLFSDTTSSVPTINPPVTLAFDDHANALFPVNGPIVTGGHRPWDHNYFATSTASYAGTETSFYNGPSGERGYTLGEFNGLAANGNWRLYVFDTVSSSAGSIAGWSVALTSVDCTDNFNLTSPAYSVSEGAGSGKVTVTRTGGKLGTASVQYGTLPGTAMAGSDYTSVSGTLSFLEGEVSKDINIPISNDTIAESDKTFQIALSTAGGNATLGAVTTATVTIVDDDPVLTPLQTWRQTNFGTTANTVDLADYDNDGIANIIEYALGLDPKQDSTSQLPTGQWIGANFVLAITQPAGVSGVTYGAEWSSTMLPGSWTDIPDVSNGNLHTFSVPAADNARLFVRLKVSAP